MPSKNIPVNGWPQIKELDIAAPILAELDKIETWQKSVKQETKTGAEVTFTNALALAAVSLSAEIEASQDLHGYDNPWAGGAYKNKLPNNLVDGTIDNITYTKLNDDSINIDGTSTGGAIREIAKIPLPNGNYIISKGSSNALFGITVEAYNDDTWVKVLAQSYSTDDVSFTVDNDGYNNIRVTIRTESGRTADNIVFYPMIRLASVSDTTFAPYSNICPISGRDSVVVDDTGKNLLECKCATFASYGVTFTNNGDGSFKLNGTSTGNFTIRLDQSIHNGSDNLKAYEAGSYTLSGASSKFYTNIMQLGTWVKLLDFGFNATNTATATQALNNCFIIIGINSGTSFNNETFKIMIERGTTATDYEPYAHSSATIQLGQTVYGGTLNVTTGVLTVTTVILVKNTADMDNSEDYPGWKESGIRALVGGGINRIITDINTNCGTAYGVNTTGVSGDTVLLPKDYYGGKTQTEWIDLAMDIQIPVTLATPTTIQLTPTQLTMLKGYNRLSSDGGDLTVTAYTGNKWN